jgi:TonB family protein
VIKTHLFPLFKNPETNLDKPGDENYICKDADKMPGFPGGERTMMNFIARSLKYPVIEQENGVQGKVEVTFVIDTNGKVKNPKVIRSVSPALDKEALRVIAILPDFIPAEKDGKKVNVYCTLPLSFRLEGEGFRKVGTEKPIVVLDDQKLPEGFNLGIINYEKLSSFKTYLPTSKAKTAELVEKYGAEASHGVTVLVSKKEMPLTEEATRPKDSNGNRIYQVIEQMPVFPEGEIKLMQFIAMNLKYPDSAQKRGIQGRVILRFVVNTTGNIEKAEVVRSLDPDCDKEALRVINSLPVWIPGRQNGVNVSVYYTLPISFKLN